MVGSWRGTGQLCWEIVTGHFEKEKSGAVSLNSRHCLVLLVFYSLNTDVYSRAEYTGPEGEEQRQ